MKLINTRKRKARTTKTLVVAVALPAGAATDHIPDYTNIFQLLAFLRPPAVLSAIKIIAIHK